MKPWEQQKIEHFKNSALFCIILKKQITLDLKFVWLILTPIILINDGLDWLDGVPKAIWTPFMSGKNDYYSLLKLMMETKMKMFSYRRLLQRDFLVLYKIKAPSRADQIDQKNVWLPTFKSFSLLSLKKKVSSLFDFNKFTASKCNILDDYIFSAYYYFCFYWRGL